MKKFIFYLSIIIFVLIGSLIWSIYFGLIIKLWTQYNNFSINYLITYFSLIILLYIMFNFSKFFTTYYIEKC